MSTRDLNRRQLLEALANTARLARIVVDETGPLEGQRLRALANTLDAERRSQGEHVRRPRDHSALARQFSEV